MMRALLFAALFVGGTAQAKTPPTEEGPRGMTLVQALVLGAVEGVTEYLPVSSTGHLILAQRVMGIGGHTAEEKEAADAYSICIQGGAILAVLGLYIGYVRRMVNGLFGRDPDGLRLILHLAIAFLPAAAIGLRFNSLIREHLFGLWPIVFAWGAGGAIILLLAWKRRNDPPLQGRTLEELTWLRALVIGGLQCLAMWPGTSRSLVTIVGGVLVGLNLPSAVLFSFLLGAVTLGAATIHDAYYSGPLMMEVYGGLNLLAGFGMATLTAIFSVKWMVSYLQRRGLALFGYYRVALALAVAALLLTGLLTDPILK